MKIMILGLGKSGTTALLYKLAAGLPGCEAFSGGRPGKYIGNYDNAVYKHTYEERKGKDFVLYREHLKKEHYDRKVWIARDPRDVAVSRMLYRWNRGSAGCRQQFKAHLELVKRKEADPASVPFHEICRYTGHHGWPSGIQFVLNEERVRYEKMHDFASSLGSDWFLFTYEDMLNRNFAALNDYLGFDVQDDTEVPDSTGKAKVVRKKASGDWRHWFTEEDVELFKPAYLPYMELIGYDCEDWACSASPVIEPEYSSDYMQKLTHRVALDTARKLKGQAQRFFSREAG
ncbi:hypothetical protein MNBD_GAMMA15-1317 [hydrothermal vent metagenome]|uniref:Sulfotransferase domain-containing protein n=1 Tax=hydrothermal vent metagenome TaxID=652676 RepID=A0A3B0YU59_9ZZZZ